MKQLIVVQVFTEGPSSIPDVIVIPVHPPVWADGYTAGPSRR